MKKIIQHIILCCICCACTTVLPDTGEDIDRSGHTRFNVDIENLSLAGTSIPGRWEDGDRIGVYGSEAGQNVPYYLKRGGEGLQAAAFYGSVVRGDIISYAPYDKGITSAIVPCELQRIQEFQPEAGKADWFLKYNPRTFAAMGEDGILHFHYPMGLLSVAFKFDEPVSVKEITLKSTKGISGLLDIDKSGYVQPSAITGKEISLDLGGKLVPSKSGSSFTEFLFVLPPAVYAAGELSLSVVTPEENMLLMLPELEVKRVENADFPVLSIVVTSKNLPGFEKEDGYLE